MRERLWIIFKYLTFLYFWYYEIDPRTVDCGDFVFFFIYMYVKHV